MINFYREMELLYLIIILSSNNDPAQSRLYWFPHKNSNLQKRFLIFLNQYLGLFTPRLESADSPSQTQRTGTGKLVVFNRFAAK